MNRFTILLPLLLLWSGAASEPIPFDPSRGLVEVEVTVNGIAEGIFGIDTGADGLYMDTDFAAENNLKIHKLREKKYVTAVGGAALAAEVDIRSLRIGDDETLYNLTATAIDMDRLSIEKGWEPPDGLIGFDILRRFYVSVNYPDASMELISHEPAFLTDHSEFVSVPFEQDGHLVLVEVDFGDGVVAPMIFDYCASLTTISYELADRLGLDYSETDRVTIPGMGISPEVWQSGVQALVTDHGAFGKGMSEVEFEGILGASFLYHWEITVDYKRQRIYVH